MGFLTGLFGANDNIGKDISDIRKAQSLSELAAIMRAADNRIFKFDFVDRAAGHKEAGGLFKNKLQVLREAAQVRARDIGLADLGLSSLYRSTRDMEATLKSTVSDVDWDLFSDSPLMSMMASDSISDCHKSVKNFLAHLPQDAATHAPALARFKNKHSDKEIKDDRFWDFLDFANYFSRSAIRDNFSEMAHTLSTARGQMEASAFEHLRKKDPKSMRTIEAVVVKVSKNKEFGAG